MARWLVRLALLLPLCTGTYGLGAHGAASEGWAHAVLPWGAITLFGLVFMAGWLGIPISGVLATVLVHELPERWRPRAQRLFVGWLLAWTGTAIGVGVWGTPFEWV